MSNTPENVIITIFPQKRLCLQTACAKMQWKHDCMIIVLKSKEWAKRSKGQVHKATPDALELQ